jgi:hypothetical protein
VSLGLNAAVWSWLFPELFFMKNLFTLFLHLFVLSLPSSSHGLSTWRVWVLFKTSLMFAEIFEMESALPYIMVI